MTTISKAGSWAAGAWVTVALCAIFDFGNPHFATGWAVGLSVFWAFNRKGGAS